MEGDLILFTVVSLDGAKVCRLIPVQQPFFIKMTVNIAVLSSKKQRKKIRINLTNPT